MLSNDHDSDEEMRYLLASRSSSQRQTHRRSPSCLQNIAQVRHAVTAILIPQVLTL